MTVNEFRKFIETNRKRLLEGGVVRRSSCPSDWVKVVLDAIVEKDSYVSTYTQAVNFLNRLSGLHIPVSGTVDADDFPGLLKEYFPEKAKFSSIMENE
jgi:hypothetical protein